VKSLSELIQRVLKNPSYRDRARYFQKVIVRIQGLDLAAGLIERAFKENQMADPVGEYAQISHS
jgi:zeaxanthin glucosyltransferase